MSHHRHELALQATSFGCVQHVVRYEGSKLKRVLWECFEEADAISSCIVICHMRLTICFWRMYYYTHVHCTTTVVVDAGTVWPSSFDRLSFVLVSAWKQSFSSISFATQNLFTGVCPQNRPEHFDHNILTMPFCPATTYCPRPFVRDILSTTFCPLHFVRDILSVTFCSHNILSATFCPVTFCPATLVSNYVPTYL